jgi:hypothetical protein
MALKKVQMIRLTLTIIAATLLLGCSDLVTERYATYEEAIRAGAGERGWLPSFTPKTATNIILSHNLDTNYQWLKFRIPPHQISDMTKGLKIISLEEARQGSGRRTPAAIGAWPPELEKVMVSTPRGSLGFFQTASISGCVCIAVDSSTGEVFGWSCECAP